MVASFVKQGSNERLFMIIKATKSATTASYIQWKRRRGKEEFVEADERNKTTTRKKKTKNGKEEAVEVDGMRKTTKRKIRTPRRRVTKELKT